MSASASSMHWLFAYALSSGVAAMINAWELFTCLPDEVKYMWTYVVFPVNCNVFPTKRNTCPIFRTIREFSLMKAFYFFGRYYIFVVHWYWLLVNFTATISDGSCQSAIHPRRYP